MRTSLVKENVLERKKVLNLITISDKKVRKIPALFLLNFSDFAIMISDDLTNRSQVQKAIEFANCVFSSFTANRP